MHKFKDIVFVLIFCGFLAIMSLGFLFITKRDFSAVENRYLEQMPKCNMEDVMNGTYMYKLERYVSDHIPLRDRWVQLHASIERISGKNENGGVYFAKKDTLINRVDKPERDRIEKNISFINSFVQTCPVSVYFGLWYSVKKKYKLNVNFFVTPFLTCN